MNQNLNDDKLDEKDKDLDRKDEDLSFKDPQKKGGRKKDRSNSISINLLTDIFNEPTCYQCNGEIISDLGECSECGIKINYGYGAEKTIIEFKLPEIADGFLIDDPNLIQKFVQRDASTISKFGEAYACRHFGSEISYTLSEDNQSDADIVADVPINLRKNFPCFEVRCFRTTLAPNAKTTPEVYFTQSKNKNEGGLLYKLSSVNGFFLIDVTLFPDCVGYYVPTPTVCSWLFLEDENLRLPKRGVISDAKNLLPLLERTIQNGIVKITGKNAFRFA